MDKEYRIACEPGTEDELVSAARFLDARMREVRGTGKVIVTDRIAVMVAHVRHCGLDAEHPASLSPAVITTLLLMVFLPNPADAIDV